MNIIEAIKTGLSLRRPVPKHKGSGGDGWLGSDYVRLLLCSRPTRHMFVYSDSEGLLQERDIIADDWEVKEPETEPVPPCGAW